ncbi:unnamed protein product [Colias eurytheme]|nr:unnamed protein product [Colias eurytheme]
MFNVKDKLKFGFLNPGSLGTNHDEFLVAMLRHSVDLMAINETWLREGEEGRAPVVPGYRLRHVPRPPSTRSRGGGVGFYIKKGLSVQVVSHPGHAFPMVEQMWLKLVVRGKVLVVGTAYRPPWMDSGMFFEALTESMGTFVWCDYIILLGDFNINTLNCNHSNFLKLDTFLGTFKLKQHVTEPTHFTANSETLLDLVCTNVPVSCVTVDHIGALSNHAFITFLLHLKKEKPLTKHITYRSIKTIDNDLFQQSLNNISWNNLLLLDDVNDLVAALTDIILSLFDFYAPKKIIHIREKHYPWITYNMKKIMNCRDKAQIKARKTKLSADKDTYLELKHYVRLAIHREKVAYFDTYINNNINRPSIMWKHIKEQVQINTKKDTILPSHINNPVEINDHFLNIPGTIPVDQSTLTYYQSHRFNDSVFKFKLVDENTVLKTVNEIKSQAIGVDDISLDMFLLTLPNSLPTLTRIINTSFQTHTFPHSWRQAIVYPIPKNNHPDSLKDLRPISVLPCLSKVIEKLVHKQLTEFLELHDILPEQQSGFRKHRGTATALMDVVDNVLCAQDDGKGTIMLLLDYSRAFDTIDINLLLCKLVYYGLDENSVKWFNSYLCNRTQTVSVLKEDGSRSLSNTTLNCIFFFLSHF